MAWFFNQVTGLTAHKLPPLPPGDSLRVPLLLLSRQEWFWRVRSSSWCSSWWATWSGLASFGCRVANVVRGSAVFSLVFLFSQRRSRCASCSGYGCSCDYTAYVPAVLRERGGASCSVLDRVLQIPVALQRRVRAVQNAQKPETPQRICWDGC